MKVAKKVLLTIYSLSALLFVLSYAQLIFNKISTADYFRARISGYGPAISSELCDLVSENLITCIALCTAVIAGIALHFVFYALSKKYVKDKKISLILHICDIVVNIICLLFLFLLLYCCSIMKTYLKPFNDYYSDYFDYYSYSFVTEAQALAIIPFVTGIIISCAHLATNIISFLGNLKLRQVNESESKHDTSNNNLIKK